MVMEAGQAGQTPIELQRLLFESARPLKAFHRVLHTALNDDVIIEFGFFDLREALALLTAAQRPAQPPAEEQSVVLYVTDRFMVTPQSAVALLDTAQRIVGHFQRRGLLPADLDEVDLWLRERKEEKQ